MAAEHPALWLYDAAGQPLATAGRGAPLPMRLFFSALLSAPLRPGRTVDLPLTVRDLVADLWPHGWQRGLATGYSEVVETVHLPRVRPPQ